ncbi:MAG: cytochrome b5-like heme/steroid binding domain-containing protein [Candidatus Dojkabacteria bacterium]|jgi:cytochrome b involved in lipid metabolism|nr:cytochrome b5-like heme/steroid binding domain-containing protein [Candidatus Dojkabacteria bacterium]
MKILITLLLSFFFIFQISYAYTLTDVSEHNSRNDCWMVFEERVFNITPYIAQHDNFQDITDWCGRDMTQDFKDKDGLGIDHKRSSYSLLETYYIGDITEEEVVVVDESKSISDLKQNSKEETTNTGTPYNIILPLLLSTSLYWIPYFLFFRNSKKFSLVKFNSFWNSILLLLLLIPGLLFGLFMILRYKFSSLWDIDFNFMYWHVELSLVMGLLALNHFLQRIKIYFAQLKK